MDDGARIDPEAARGWIAERRTELRQRLDGLERRLTEVRRARGEWTDEEHDPEGFALTFEWSEAAGARAENLAELAELEAADARVDARGYGVCERCGRIIPVEQLRRRPARTVCVACTDHRR